MKFVDEIVIKNNDQLKISKHEIGGTFVAKSNGIVSGISLVADILQKQSSKNVIYHIKEDGDMMHRGDSLLSVRGPYDEIVKIKEVCQNLLADLSGVSTSLLKYIQEIKDLNTRILFFENTLPGYGEHYNLAIINAGGQIINRRTGYLDVNIWDSDVNVLEIIENINEEEIFVEVNNIEEFNQVIYSKCSHIVCVDFGYEDLEVVSINKNNKQIGIRTNMTYANIHAYASKNLDFVIINNFYNSHKRIDVEFRYFKNRNNGPVKNSG